MEVRLKEWNRDWQHEREAGKTKQRLVNWNNRWEYGRG
jgi:hypothetical protein